MWIKHNKALYNTSEIKKIEARRTKLVATFNDGEEIVIGEFRAMKECEDHLSNLTKKLLFELEGHEGVIIHDTKGKK